ncbi:ABC transporter substrate-binding protein [Paenibacillus sp. FSL R7-0273]|uniref:ABC transporter substrate-binding protein n=1 Tax=Paenibacillus sp. FSL R7-0273 TaxID=1536772 RepID=UPI0004F5BE21|nr:sugar ABC transporter substrate-binding protein [Paenibacillus sp. FSL R7-0273]AIQ45949.1 ABC transporter substrate-binding protein [Paenibacillus sp. FSL R7-0273]OMF87402.1 ABC transporter substrate-binding protein [Paenibacillus sp. FSL R7-0273]
MKKQLLLASLSTVLALGLAGCGGSDNTENAGGDQKPGAAGEKTKISYWTGDRHDADFVKEKVAEFNATNTDGIEVELVVKGDDFDTALDLSFQTADSPDVIRVKENTIGTFYKKEYLAPIDEFLSEELKTKFPEMKDLNTFDGKRYSLPNYGTTMRLVYNKDLFAKAGVTSPPTTLQELVDTAKKLTEAGKADGAYGFAQNFKSPPSALGRSARVIAEMSGFGGFGYDFRTARFDFSGFKPIIEAFKQIKDDGSMLPGVESLDIDPLRAQFAEGKIGMYLSFSSEPGVYSNQFPAKIDWAAAPAPTIDGNAKGASGFLGGQWLALSSKSEHKEAAWKFMEYMYSDQILTAYQENGYGISMVPSVSAVAKTPEVNGIEGFLPNQYDGVWPVYPTVAPEGMKSDDAFFKYMLNGGDLDAVIADLNKRYNAALDDAIKNDGLKAEPDAGFDPASLAGKFAK